MILCTNNNNNYNNKSFFSQLAMGNKNDKQANN